MALDGELLIITFDLYKISELVRIVEKLSLEDIISLSIFIDMFFDLIQNLIFSIIVKINYNIIFF